MPELMLVIAALVLLVIDPMLPADGRRGLSFLGIFACITAGISAWLTRNEVFSVFNHSIAVDRYAVFFKVLFPAMAVVAMLLSERYLSRHRRLLGDYYALILLATVGMMVMAEAVDVVTLYVGIELAAFSGYLLAGFLRNSLTSMEAALKYFLTGIFASAFILFGIALIYGATGSTNYLGISEAIRSGQAAQAPLVIAIIMLLGGFGFKLALVPFHNWAPDVYQGAPAPAAALLASGPKVAGFAAVIKLFIIALGSQSGTWVSLMIALSIATLLAGSTLALVQRDLKRMLAYSSIAHGGYLLMALIATGEMPISEGAPAALFYLACYTVMNLGAFGVVVWLENRLPDFDGTFEELAGLARRSPWIAGIMALFMLSLTGIPPTAGFFAKFYLFTAVVDAGLAWLAVIGILFSVVSAFYYLRVIVYMYMRSADGEAAADGGGSPDLNIGLALAALGVIVLGVLPGPVLDAARAAVGGMLGY